MTIAQFRVEVFGFNMHLKKLRETDEAGRLSQHKVYGSSLVVLSFSLVQLSRIIRIGHVNEKVV